MNIRARLEARPLFCPRCGVRMTWLGRHDLQVCPNCGATYAASDYESPFDRLALRLRDASFEYLPGGWMPALYYTAERPRLFYLYRASDVSGVSGTGIVADGAAFPDGKVAVCWRRSAAGITNEIVYDSIADVEKIHGHGGLTSIRWVDGEGD